MIVYSDKSETVSARDELARLGSSDLIRFGQIESGIVDALCPEMDEESDITRALRECSVRQLPQLNLPEQIRISAPEGFAYYSLYPEMYADAARRWVRDVGPARCIVIGIRSIGATLSSVVVRELRKLKCIADSFTVRPRGHPYDRKLVLSLGLQERIRNAIGAQFLIVDEGPGLSGSSFVSVAVELNRLGIPDEYITLFPSWDTDGASLWSDTARQKWAGYRRYVSTFEDVCLPQLGPTNLQDLSGGLWRSALSCDAAVHPQLERRKYIDGSKRRLWKFSGLAHFGERKLERARQLAQFTPPALGLSHGFLLSEWLPGNPLSVRDVTPELLDTMARYLSHLRSTFTLDQYPDFDAILWMMQVNTGCELDSLRRDRALIEDEHVVQLDGRMLPHEWLITAAGYKKTDALDHHDDHFFPGAQDIAWDLAGAAVEFRMDPAPLVDRYLRHQHDPTLRRRMPFYTLAYLSYRYGYSTMATLSLGESPDAHRFSLLADYYARELAERSVVPKSS